MASEQRLREWSKHQRQIPYQWWGPPAVLSPLDSDLSCIVLLEYSPDQEGPQIVTHVCICMGCPHVTNCLTDMLP